MDIAASAGISLLVLRNAPALQGSGLCAIPAGRRPNWTGNFNESSVRNASQELTHDDRMMRRSTPWGVWDPASPDEVAAELEDLEAPWWIAGGWAIELAAGRPLREHADTDVLVLRRDHLTVQHHLAGRWDLWAVDPPGTLRLWHPGEHLPQRVNGVWCRRDPQAPWCFELMIDESDGDEWVSRRHAGVRRALRDLGCTTPGGIPFLRPEVQLFYKSKGRRPRDETDLEAMLPLLGAGARRWLDDAVALVEPGNPWRARLVS
jgi:aminoglycoside-2''-adenylyltransferase